MPRKTVSIKGTSKNKTFRFRKAVVGGAAPTWKVDNQHGVPKLNKPGIEYVRYGPVSNDAEINSKLPTDINSNFQNKIKYATIAPLLNTGTATSVTGIDGNKYNVYAVTTNAAPITPVIPSAPVIAAPAPITPVIAAPTPVIAAPSTTPAAETISAYSPPPPSKRFPQVQTPIGFRGQNALNKTTNTGTVPANRNAVLGGRRRIKQTK